MHWKRHLHDFVETQDFSTQQQLVHALQEAGCEVNQGTVSRELTRTNIRKVGGFYRLPPRRTDTSTSILSMSATSGGALCVIRTKPAFASVVAQVIDENAEETVLGTVAGDDTVFVATTGIEGLRYLEILLKIKSD